MSAPVADTAARRVLQRVVLPTAEHMDTVPLYVDAGAATSATNGTGAGGPLGGSDAPSRSGRGAEQTVSAPDAVAGQIAAEAHHEDFRGRRSTVVRPGSRLSFGTYFNAFPASYWRRWTSVETVRLSVRTSGEGTVIVYKSNARGSLQRVASRRVTGSSEETFDLPLRPFGDGGWYWFDLAAGSEEMVLESAEWSAADTSGKPEGTITLEITTLNKADYCLDNLRTLAENPDVLAVLRELVIVDQGTDKVQDQPDFEEVAAGLQGKLRIINQSNLGGSGGFSRGMYEGVQNGSDYVLLLDDDVVVEPESILRMLTFADFCRKPTIVGGHMFDLFDRTVLYSFGETINTYRFHPAEATEAQYQRHDFAARNLRSTPWLHRRADVDYNGWWMDLIPTSVIKEIGLSLPVFIKWDDMEYGLRAKAHGVHTVSLPGSAVWHISWADKDDLVNWQSYFHVRNRLIAALLYSPYDRGGRVVRETEFQSVKHLISMQYYTEDIRIRALNDVLAGPDQLHAIQPTRLGEVRAATKDYSDAQFSEDIESYPEPHMSKPPRQGKGFRAPSYKALIPWAAKTVARQLIKPVEPEYEEHPQAHIAHQDNKWWRMSQYDSALVSNAEGTATSWYKRRPDQLRTKMVESARLHAELLRRWPELAETYRKALGEITSLEAWKKTFDEHTDSELTR